MTGVGILLPFRGFSAHTCLGFAREADGCGYESIWSAEVSGEDSLTLLAACAVQTRSVRLGTAIVPMASRSIAALTMAASTLARLAPGRFILGIGVSSPEIVEDWHGVNFGSPIGMATETLTALRKSLSGERMEFSGTYRSCRGFRLADPPNPSPDLFLAALGPNMRGVAARLADGVILNFLPAGQALSLCEELKCSHAELEVTALVRVCLTSVNESCSENEFVLRKELASYLRFPQYQRWMAELGYGDVVDTVCSRRELVDKAMAIPKELMREVAAVGSLDECRAFVERLVSVGVKPIIVPSSVPGDIQSYRGVLHAMSECA